MFLNTHCFRDPKSPEFTSGVDPYKEALNQLENENGENKDKLKQDIDQDPLSKKVRESIATLNPAQLKIAQEGIKGLGFNNILAFEKFLEENPKLEKPMAKMLYAQMMHAYFNNQDDRTKKHYLQGKYRDNGNLVENFNKNLKGPGPGFSESRRNLTPNWQNMANEWENSSWKQVGKRGGAALTVWVASNAFTTVMRHAAYGDAEFRDLIMPRSHLAKAIGGGMALQSLGVPVGETVGLGLKAGFNVSESIGQNLAETLDNPLHKLDKHGLYNSETGQWMERGNWTKSHIETGEFFKEQRAQADYYPEDLKPLALKIINYQEQSLENKEAIEIKDPEDIEMAAKHCWETHQVTLDGQEQFKFMTGILKGEMDELSAERFIYTSSNRIMMNFFLSSPKYRDKFAKAYEEAAEDKSAIMLLSPYENEHGIKDILTPPGFDQNKRADRQKIHEEMAQLKKKLNNNEKILGVIDPELGLTGNLAKLWGMSMLPLSAMILLMRGIGKIKDKWNESKETSKVEINDNNQKSLLALFEKKDAGDVIKQDNMRSFFEILKKEKIISPFTNINAERHKKRHRFNPLSRVGKDTNFTLEHLGRNARGKIPAFKAKNNTNEREKILSYEDIDDEMFRKFTKTKQAIAGGNREKIRKAFHEDLENMGNKMQDLKQKEMNYFKNLKRLEAASKHHEQNKSMDLKINLQNIGNSNDSPPEINVRLKRSRMGKTSLQKSVKNLKAGKRINEMITISGENKANGNEYETFNLFFNNQGELLLQTTKKEVVSGSSMGGVQNRLRSGTIFKVESLQSSEVN